MVLQNVQHAHIVLFVKLLKFRWRSQKKEKPPQLKEAASLD
jgi:hypothetical protein